VESAARPEMPLLLVNLHRRESNADLRKRQSEPPRALRSPRAGP
jgi:hypothetical protein